MKKLITIVLLMISTIGYSQTYYHLNHSVKTDKKKMAFPSVSVTFAPISYTQINFAASFFQVTLNQGQFTTNGSTLSFTPSYVTGGANAEITVTSSGDTLYKLSQNIYYGVGLSLSENIVTGKVGTAPSLVGGIGNFSALAGYDLINKVIVMGISASINDLPFINKHTSITIKNETN